MRYSLDVVVECFGPFIDARFIRYFLIALTIFVSACASSPPLLPIADSDRRVQFNGFSVLPPSNQGWNWVGREGQSKSTFFNTTFVKKDGRRTYLAIAALLDTEGKDYSDTNDLMGFVKASKFMQENPRQLGIRPIYKVDHTLGRPCVRYDFEAQDTGAPGSPGMIFNIDGHGLVCTHPDKKDVLGWFAYTRRSPQGQDYIAGTDEGERFLRSVQFTKIRR